MSLIKKAKNGDLEALSELIEQSELILYKTAKAILNNEEDVRDAIQETLTSIFLNLKSLKEEKYFKTWATRIVINKCYDIINKNDLNNKKIDKAKAVHEVEEKSNWENNLEKNSQLENALNSIDEKLKLITVMYYYNNFKVKEIADILKIPEGTVKYNLAKAREELYKLLTE